MSGLHLTLKADTEAFCAALAELGDLISSAPEIVSKDLLGLDDLVGELVRIRSDGSPTASANELTVTLEPTDLLRRLVAALRAGDFDNGVFDDCRELIAHNSSSVGCVEPPNEGRASGESQDLSDARSRNAQGVK